MISREDALIYEIHSRWWTGLIGWDWAQRLIGAWFGWKVQRKYRRYSESMAIRRRLILRDAMRGVRS